MKNAIIFTGSSSPICQSLLKNKSFLDRYDLVFTYSRTKLLPSDNTTKQLIHNYTSDYQVPKLLSGLKVDIFHAAAAVPAYYPDKQWEIYKKINVCQPLSFIKRVEKIANKVSFFFLSTTSVYDKTVGNELFESSKKTNEENFYGYSKLLFEDNIKKLEVRYLGLRVPVLLCPNVKHNFLSNLKKNFIEKKVIRISHPQALFNAIVSDRDILRLCCAFFDNDIKCGIYNAGTSNPTTLHSLFTLIGTDYEIIESSCPPQLVNINKLQLENFVPETTVEAFVHYFIN